jgi:arabinan endo-1,5-alpha-L-arabinosidase
MTQSGRTQAYRCRAKRMARVWASLALSASTLASLTPAARASQPVAQCPDPTILIDHSAAAAATLMCTGQGFPTRSAATIDGLSDARPHPAFAPGGWPHWASGRYWAPDLKRVGDQYLLYYSARLRSARRHCIGVALSDRPDGGFRDLGTPLIDEGHHGAIDPAPLAFDDQLFLFYKREGNPSIIVGKLLSSDGLQVAGPEVSLLRSRPAGWEHGVVEGPAPVIVGNTTYLLYSEGHYYSPGYAEGEAVLTLDPLGPYSPAGPLGPYRRVSTTPVLHGRGRWVGTAGGSIVIDGTRLLLAYAAFRPGQPSLRRLLFIRDLGLQAGVLRPVGPAQEIRLRDH